MQRSSSANALLRFQTSDSDHLKAKEDDVKKNYLELEIEKFQKVLSNDEYLSDEIKGHCNEFLKRAIEMKELKNTDYQLLTHTLYITRLLITDPDIVIRREMYIYQLRKIELNEAYSKIFLDLMIAIASSVRLSIVPLGVSLGIFGRMGLFTGTSLLTKESAEHNTINLKFKAGVF